MSCSLLYFIPVTPLISDISSFTEVRLGMPAVLVCLVTGYPLPSIAWKKDFEEFSNSSRVDRIRFPTGSDESQDMEYMQNSSIVDLLIMHTTFTMNQVLQLGELGVVGLLSFQETVRGDTANYTCSATNSLHETTTLTTVSHSIPLVILGRFPITQYIQLTNVVHSFL